MFFSLSGKLVSFNYAPGFLYIIMYIKMEWNELLLISAASSRINVSAPKKFSVTTGRSLINLPTLQSRRQYLFHNFTHKKVAKNKASKHILNLVQKSNKHQRCLRSNCSIIKPSFRTNFGKSALLNLLHKFRLKNNSAKTILTFNLPGT